MTPVVPRAWSSEEFEEQRLRAVEIFRQQRLQEDPSEYLDVFDDYRGAVEDLLEKTVDLSRLSNEAIDVLTDPPLLEAVRYLAGPPVSVDDLETLAEASLARTRLRNDAAMAKRVIDTVLMALDRRRFAWVSEDREPTPTEREAAALGSAALMASQFIETKRRNEAKSEQENAVKARLLANDFTEISRRVIATLRDAPAPGEFCPESRFAGRKADLVVGLWDNRSMPLECKVSNSYTNSVKRLNNDAAVKAVRWREKFGSDQVVPAAVLSGAYKRHNLEDAQANGLTIFWAHDLDALIEFVETTKQP